MVDDVSFITMQVRAGIVGYPNVGKSSLINRLLKRRMCAAAPRPGVTRELKYVKFNCKFCPFERFWSFIAFAVKFSPPNFSSNHTQNFFFF